MVLVKSYHKNMKTFICIDKDSLTGGYQICIEHDGGMGFRLAGPKYSGNSKRLLTHEITPNQADEIRTYLDEQDQATS
jgi:hypothetical protein